MFDICGELVLLLGRLDPDGDSVLFGVLLSLSILSDMLNFVFADAHPGLELCR